jgi:hypothetical protein
MVAKRTNLIEICIHLDVNNYHYLNESLIFANCQGEVLKHFFPDTFQVRVFLNYQRKDYTSLEPIFLTDLQECDWFIYQPLSTKYPVYNTSNLITLLKSGCRTISFPYIYNDAFIPIVRSLRRDYPSNGEYSTGCGKTTVYKNTEPITLLKEKGLTLEQVYHLYDTDQIDFKYQDRFDKSISILQDKETETDVKISKFIVDNHKKHRLFNYDNDPTGNICCNHPSNVMIRHYVSQIFHIMGVDPKPFPNHELIGMGTNHVSRYDIAFYRFEWVDQQSPQIDSIIKNLIKEVYDDSDICLESLTVVG